jgi:DNA (cytosine-5)-methyltransferase 1
MPAIPVIDLFAGPGGLNEGFSRLGESIKSPAFTTIASIEMESSACSTLRLRGAFRKMLRDGEVEEDYYRFVRGEIEWKEFESNETVKAALEHAVGEVHQVELGVDQDESDEIIREALEQHNVKADDKWVLIGGPPCQAYSLAGRSRRANDVEFEKDKKHFLYREYLNIIAKFVPTIFVMENVKGLLSSTNAGVQMFELIKKDLENPARGVFYDIHSVTVSEPLNVLRPSDYIIRSERFGVPQKRHRVILLGVLRGSLPPGTTVGKLVESEQVTVSAAISGLPRLRSGISPARLDNVGDWRAIRAAAKASADEHEGFIQQQFCPNETTVGVAAISDVPDYRGGQFVNKEATAPVGERYANWVLDSRINGTVQHETRSHMVEDLKRYWFASTEAERSGVSPKLRSFPKGLLPNHKNATAASRPFEDRFRVQVWEKPATTIVSHIAKDGHYYIHPDPSQMRSLTVREAARLQSFPDNYFFMGNRTQQYHQVGNAVPPLLANQIAKVVADLLEQIVPNEVE